MSLALNLAELSPTLRPRVTDLIAECPYPLGISSAWRSKAEQQRLYDGWKRRLPGYAPANPPGMSRHEDTLNGKPAANACDLDYPNGASMRAAAVKWVHANAARFGLHFPIHREDWHVESNGRPYNPRPVQEDDVTKDDIKAIAAAVRAEVQKDIITVLRAADQPSLKSLDERLSRIEEALGSGK